MAEKIKTKKNWYKKKKAECEDCIRQPMFLTKENTDYILEYQVAALRSRKRRGVEQIVNKIIAEHRFASETGTIIKPPTIK